MPCILPFKKYVFVNNIIFLVRIINFLIRLKLKHFINRNIFFQYFRLHHNCLIMSFRDKLNVCRSGFNNFDNTVNTHYFCIYCFQRVNFSRSTIHTNTCTRRPLYSSSSSDSESSSDDSLSSEDIEEEIQENEEAQKDRDKALEEKENALEDEEEIQEDKVEKSKQKQ